MNPASKPAAALAIHGVAHASRKARAIAMLRLRSRSNKWGFIVVLLIAVQMCPRGRKKRKLDAGAERAINEDDG
jgi:hypothetical protein